MSTLKKYYKAFTLIELIIAQAFLLGLTLILLPIGISQLDQNTLYNNAQKAASTIFQVQQRAYSAPLAQLYVIEIGQDALTLLQGDDENTLSLDIVVNMSEKVSITNNSFENNRIIFEAGNFRPWQEGYLVLEESGLQFTVQITKEGRIVYDQVL